MKTRLLPLKQSLAACAIIAGAIVLPVNVRADSFGFHINAPGIHFSFSNRPGSNASSADSTRPAAASPSPSPAAPLTHRQHIRHILTQIQLHLVPFVNVLVNDTIMNDLAHLSPDSNAAQRAAVRSGLLTMIDDDFLAEMKKDAPGNITVFTARLRAIAVHREPSVAKHPELLAVIDDTVHELFFHPM